MILLWKGRGWLVVVLGLLSLVFSVPCGENFVLMANYEQETYIQIGIALIYAGVFIRTFFILFPAKAPRHFIDAETGEDVFVSPVDSLYYLDAKFWAYGFLGAGILMFSIAFYTALL